MLRPLLNENITLVTPGSNNSQCRCHEPTSSSKQDPRPTCTRGDNKSGEASGGYTSDCKPKQVMDITGCHTDKGIKPCAICDEATQEGLLKPFFN